MIKVLPLREKDAVEKLFLENKIEYNENCLAVRATDKDDLLGYTLFSIDKNVLNLYLVETFNDFSLVDGLVRSSLHVGVENGVTDAYCCSDTLFDTLKLLDFIKNEQTKEINIERLFQSCCGCK